MDGLPIELVKLCRLASMAECGDHLWATVPSLLSWSVVLSSVAERLAIWRSAAPANVLTPAASGEPAEA